MGTASKTNNPRAAWRTVFDITRSVPQPFAMFGVGPAVEFFVVHRQTATTVGRLPGENIAQEFAAELFEKLPASKWRTSSPDELQARCDHLQGWYEEWMAGVGPC